MNDIPDPSRHSLTEQVMALVAKYSKTLFVPADRFDISLLGKVCIPGVTKLRDCTFLDAANTEGCEDWVCQQVKPYRSGGIHEFLFVPVVSTTDARKWVLETWDTEPYPWPAELLDFRFIPDPYFSQSGTSAKDITGTGTLGRVFKPRIYTQRAYRDAVSCATLVRYRFYISNKPFPKWDFITPQLQPTEISCNFGTDVRLLCLHDDLTIPAQSMVYQALYGSVLGTQGSGEVPEQFFPRTTFKKRAPFDVVSQNPQADATGFFIKIKKTFYPPPPGKITELAN